MNNRKKITGRPIMMRELRKMRKTVGDLSLGKKYYIQK